jgi:CHAT domain-containing protein/predicted negative regulator of RcsB-dependent stress response
MRRLIIASFSALILLCTPVSAPHGCGLPTIPRAPLMFNLHIQAGSPAPAALRPVSPSAQATVRERGTTQSAQESASLEHGKPIERELSGGQSHFYRIAMASGQFLQIAVVQRGIDVVVALSTPDGKKIVDMDSDHTIEGSETVLAIAEVAGAYLIEVRSPEKAAKPGRYYVKVEELRAATVEDKYRVAATTISREAEQLKSGSLDAKRKSIEKYQEALEIYRKANDQRGEAQTLNNIGEVNWSIGEMQNAMGKFNEALPIFKALGDRKGEATALANRGWVYLSLGEMQKALEKFDEALPIFKALGDREGAAHILNSIGRVYWEVGEMQKALDKYNEALQLRRELGDRRAEASTLAHIGSVYSSLGERQKALEKFNEALLIRHALGDRSGEAATLTNIGTAHLPLGEIQKALDKYNEALLISREIGDRRVEANTLSNIGTVYSLLGERQKALDKYNEALTISQAISDRRGEAFTLNSIGLVYRSSGETQKALEKYNEALLIRRAIGDRSGEAVTLYHIGTSYSELGELQKALEKFNEALPISRATGDRMSEAVTLNNIGKVYSELGELQKALDKYNEALQIRRVVGIRNGEANTLLDIARVEQKRGNLTQARQSIEQAISIVESLRADIGSRGLRSSFFASRQGYYESYIDVLLQMHKQNPAASFDALALAVSERARARSLLDLLIEARADIRQGIDSQLLERERSLRQRLSARAAAQANLLNRKHTPEQAEAVEKEVASIIAEYEKLEAQIRASSPRYAALTRPQPLNLSEIQQQVLDPETLLLEYSLGENASYLFSVSHNSIASHQLPKRAEIEAAARRVYELLTAQQPRPGETETQRQARINEASANYWPEAAALSRMLLGPVASQLGKKRLVIVADGALQYIPFAALPLPSPVSDRNSGADPQPLIGSREVVSLPSASTLATLRRETAGRKPAEKSLAVLADPVFADDDMRVKRLASKTRVERRPAPAAASQTEIAALQMSRSGQETGAIDRDARFGRLLNTRREATAILALVPERERRQALDFEASRATALRPDLGQYRIVHFATHGLLNNIHPELSGIVLSLVDQDGQPQDGFLRLQDIYNLKLPAELVVLSACQTGLGKEIKGEGLVGLTRGFMYAGTPRIVASLWKVDDMATSELMKRFYQGLLGPKRLRPAEALRQAQMSIWQRKQWRAPFYWAAFVLQGEWK